MLALAHLAAVGQFASTDQYGFCLPSTVDHESVNGAGTNSRCCFGIVGSNDPDSSTYPYRAVGGATVIDTYPAGGTTLSDDFQRSYAVLASALGATRYHCLTNRTSTTGVTNFYHTESFFTGIVPQAESLPPSCDQSTYQSGRDTYTIDRDECIAQCQAVLSIGTLTSEEERYGERIPTRKCGYAEDGSVDPDKAGEEEYALSNPLPTTITDSLYGPGGASPRAF